MNSKPNRAAALFIFLLGMVLIFSGIGQLIDIRDGTPLIFPGIAFIGLGTFGIACLWKASKMWQQTNVKLGSTIPKKTHQPLELKLNRSVPPAMFVPLTLCFGSAVTFIIGIGREDTTLFKWGLIGFTAGTFTVLSNWLAGRKKRKKAENGFELSNATENTQPDTTEDMKTDVSATTLAEIRKKILECSGPACVRIAKEEEIISLGEKAVPVAVDILKNVRSVNQGLLTMSLLHFANNGNELADQTLHDIAEGKIQIDPFSFGDIALRQAQLYVAEKQGVSPKSLWLEAGELDKAGQYDKAIVNYKKYLELLPDDVYALLAIGNMYKNSDQLNEAISWWKKALASGLKHPHAGIVVKEIEKAKASLEVSTRSLSESQKDSAEKLQIGMPYEEIVNILGQPTTSMGGNEAVDVTQNTGTEVPSALANMMGNKTFMEWDKPEGIYKLVIENNKLTNIFMAPER